MEPESIRSGCCDGSEAKRMLQAFFNVDEIHFFNVDLDNVGEQYKAR
jgi:hypothetical protein